MLTTILGSVPTGATSFTVSGVPTGRYYLRVLAQNSAGTSAPSMVVALGPTPPNPPSFLAESVNGNLVTLSWTAPVGGSRPTTYVIEAGTATGLSDLGVLPTGNTATSVSGSVPNGRYFVRVRAANSAGSSAPSGEVAFVVGPLACTAPPAAPNNLQAVLVGSTVTLTWSPGGGPLNGYQIEVGSAPGLSNLGVVQPGSTVARLVANGAPPGVYFVRVRGVNPCGVSAPSGEITISVP